jgi:hypothetical protein
MHRITVLRLTAAFAVGVLAASVPAVTWGACEASKNRAAGKYAFCRQNAAAKLATTGDGLQYSDAIGKCEVKFSGAWQTAVDRAAAEGCFDFELTEGDFDDLIASHADKVKAALAGGGFLGECENDLASCQGNLGTCEPAQQGERLKTGQTSCYDSSGSAIGCAGTGHDGDLQQGLARSYTDNGDGTITDSRTGLMWEKLADDGSIHDWNDIYGSRAGFGKVVALNSASFAGHTDWRLPNVNELQSLLNYGFVNPAVDAAFNTACAPGCSVTTCSCTRSDCYWSSTIHQQVDHAWEVSFGSGHVIIDHFGDDACYVRAVRPGS